MGRLGEFESVLLSVRAHWDEGLARDAVGGLDVDLVVQRGAEGQRLQVVDEGSSSGSMLLAHIASDRLHRDVGDGPAGARLVIEVHECKLNSVLDEHRGVERRDDGLARDTRAVGELDVELVVLGVGGVLTTDLSVGIRPLALPAPEVVKLTSLLALSWC